MVKLYPFLIKHLTVRVESGVEIQHIQFHIFFPWH
jgi:hypothetical protein